MCTDKSTPWLYFVVFLFALFISSCKHKDCQAKIGCRYSSKEAVSTDEEPIVIRLIVVIHLTYHR